MGFVDKQLAITGFACANFNSTMEFSAMQELCECCALNGIH